MDNTTQRTGRAASHRYGLVVGAAMLLAVSGAVAPALAAPGAPQPGITEQAVGENRVEPAPSDQPVTAGPWSFAISEILTGDDAAAAVAAASEFNLPAAEGMQYVAVHLSATNNGSEPLTIESEDFAITGDSLLVHRFADVVAPDPALAGVVEPGAALDGWIVVPATAGEGNLMLIYDSVTITGSWSDAVIALNGGATVADQPNQAAEANDAGSEIDAPAGLNEAIVTDAWSITVTQVLEGQDVYNLFPSADYRTTALGDTDQAGLPFWVAIEVEVTNNRTGGVAAFLPSTAFLPIDTSGDPIIDALLLTPPEPSLIGGYYPGGSRTGWVLFAMPVGTALDLVRFVPYESDGDPRFITLSGVAGTPDRGEVSFAAGETVVIIEDEVNLREEATTDSDVVVILEKGTELEITGEAVEAGGWTWYPVKDPESGDEGYVVVDYLGYPE